MTYKPKISIVTPSYNQGSFIEDTIISVINQSYENIEYIIMDGGSSDETVSVIKKYSDRIKFWVSERDGGQSDALQRGFARATGDILGWINSDDSLAPGALDAIAAGFESGVDIVAGVVSVWSESTLAYHHRTGLQSGQLQTEQILNLENEWLTGRFFYQPEVYFTRKIYDAAGGYIDTNLHYSMDYDLWLRMAIAGAKILTIDHPIANFRLHPEQKTSTTAAYLPELTRHANAARQAQSLPEISPIDPARSRSDRPLRVGMLNDYGFRYGAGRAHRRIAESIASSGIEVFAYVLREDFNSPVIGSTRDAIDAFKSANVDVIIVGNVHGAYPEGMPLGDLADLAPVLLVTHDFFWFTGRCPYPMSCDAFLFSCPSTCPTRDEYPVIPYADIPTAHLDKLSELIRDNIFLTANSSYLQIAAQQFVALKMPGVDVNHKVRRLTLGVPEEAFQPLDRARSRHALGIPSNAFVILTSSSSVADPRKGFRHVLGAYRLANDPSLLLLAMGRVEDAERVDGVKYTGHLESDEHIAQCFAAADVYVSGSVNETFGQTFIEAAMCGCPSIGYAVGGIAEAVVPGQTGWLVQPNDIAGIAQILRRLSAQDQQDRDAARKRAHLYAKSRFSTPSMVAMLNDIFRSVVHKEGVRVSTGVQFGGSRTAPVHILQSQRVATGEGFDPPEGPYPEHGIDAALQWQTQPRAKIRFTVPSSGPHAVRILLANLVRDQTVSFFFEGKHITSLPLPADTWQVRTEIILALPFATGLNILEIELTKANRDDATRNLYIALFELNVAATDIADGVRSVIRLVSGEFASDAHTGEGNQDSANAENEIVDDASSSPDPEKEALIVKDTRVLQSGLHLSRGYASIEGPYTELKIPMKLAWQTSPQAKFLLQVNTAQGTAQRFVTIIFVLPVPQPKLTITIEGTAHHYYELSVSEWHAPTRIVAPLLEAEQAWVTVDIEAKNSIVDRDGRNLFLAMLEASVTASHNITDTLAIEK